MSATKTTIKSCFTNHISKCTIQDAFHLPDDDFILDYNQQKQTVLIIGNKWYVEIKTKEFLSELYLQGRLLSITPLKSRFIERIFGIKSFRISYESEE